MITFTPRAIKAAQEALASSGETFAGLRVTAERGGCSGPSFGLGLVDEGEPDDAILDVGGLRVFVDPASLALAEGASVDFVEDERGAAFVFTSPKGKGGCGCGGHR